MSSNEQVTGKVKWFNQYKGYGFVEVKGIPEDVFLHFSVVEQSNIKNLGKDDVILCIINKSDNGYQVTKIEEIVCPNKFSVDDRTKHVTAVMKWFNPSKGFGFAQLETGEDVFIHSSLLKRSNVEDISPSQKVNLLVHYTNLGYEALELSLGDE